MSPEQAKDGRVDSRSDIYSCGVMLYQMVTGRVPFLARSPLSILAKHVLEEPKPPIELNPSIDPLLDAVILKAMSKDPNSRHQTARELRSDLRALLGRARSRDLHTQPIEHAAV